MIFFYLWRRNLPFLFLVPAGVLMLVIPFAGMWHQAFIGTASSPSWLASGNWLLLGFAGCSLILEIWLILEACCLIPHTRAQREPQAVPHLLDT